MRELLVTQQYHSPDLSTQGKGLFGIKVIFPLLPPRLVKAPASRACLILNSLREWIRCPVKHASLPKCCMQIGTKGKNRASGTPAMNVESMGWQSAWLGRKQGAVVPQRHRTSWAETDALHLLQSQICHVAPGSHFIHLCVPMTKKTSPAGGWEAALPLSSSLADAASQPCLKAKSCQSIFWEQPYHMKGLVRGSLRDQSLSPPPVTRDLPWKPQRCASLHLTSPKGTRRLHGSSPKTHRPAFAWHRKNSG